MAVMNEEFHRCGCGNADFKEETIVTLLKNPRKRYDMELEHPLPVISREVHYICTSCQTKLNK